MVHALIGFALATVFSSECCSALKSGGVRSPKDNLPPMLE